MNIDKNEWPSKLDISSRDRYTKKHGGVIWKISTVDFIQDHIGLVSLNTEEHKETEVWEGSGHEFLEKFVKIEWNDELANVAGKMINSAKVQIEYYALRKETPEVAFLKSSQV